MSRIRIILWINLFHQMIILGTRLLIPMLGNELGASNLEIGFIASTFSVFPLLLAIKAGAWIDRWKPRSPIIIGSIGVAFAIFIPFISPSIPALYMSQAAAGVSQIFINLALQNSIGLICPPEHRDRYFGWFAFTISGGQFLGPLFIGFIADAGQLTDAYLAAFFISVIPIILGFFLKTAGSKASNGTNQAAASIKGNSEAENAVQISTFQLLKINGMHQAILSSMLAQLTKDVMLTYFPLFAMDQGISATGIGWILGVQGLASMFIRLLQGNIVNAFKRHWVLFYTLFSSGICYLLLPFYNQIWYYAVLTGLIGLGLGLVQPLSLTAVINLSQSGNSGKALGIRITGNRLSQMISPILFGFIAQTFSIVPVFGVCGSILMIGAFYTSWERSPQS